MDELKPCKCGGIPLYERESKCSESDDMLIKIKCSRCKNEVYRSVNKMQNKQPVWNEMEHEWNVRFSDGTAKHT